MVKLHRSISLDRPLIVVALEREAQHLHVTEVPVLVTGVGKISAASALSAVLARQRPSRIINMGTAGALREGLAGTQVAGRVIQHDFDDETIWSLTGDHYGPPIELGPGGPVLGSGDFFVRGGAPREALLAQGVDLVDMEGYAVARVAQSFGLAATLVKQISDGAGESAGQSWEENLDECAGHLGAWLEAELAAS